MVEGPKALSASIGVIPTEREPYSIRRSANIETSRIRVVELRSNHACGQSEAAPELQSWGSTQSRTFAACGGRHELFVPGDISKTRKPHGFTCPATSEVVELDRSIIGWWKTVSSKPRDAVVVREI